MAQRRFVSLLAVRRLVPTSLTAVQAAFVAGLKLGATDRAVLLVDLPCDVLVPVATGRTTENSSQLLERLQTVLALGAAGGLQTDVRLVPFHRLEASARAIAVVHTALRKKSSTLRALQLLWRPALVVPNAPGPCGFVIAIMITILRSAVAVIKHAFALGAPFHRFCTLFTAQILGATFHAAMSMGFAAWCVLLPAPDAGLWKVLTVLFTCQGGPSGHSDGTCACLAPSTAACTACAFHSLDRAAAPYWALRRVPSNERSVSPGVSSAHGPAHSVASNQHLRELGYVGFVVPVPVVKQVFLALDALTQ